MITLLASIAGFLSSFAPEILKLFKDKSDKKHELCILDRQIEFSRLTQTQRLEEIHITRDIAEQASLYSTYKTGVTFIDALNGSVRPILAYCFFIMYALVKLVQYKAIFESLPKIIYLETIWNIDDQAIFAGILSFYFGQRTFSKKLKYK